MKRSWFGAGLLLGLLIAAVLVTWTMDRVHDPVSRDLGLAAGCAVSGDWASADALAEEARGQWMKWDHLRRCFADHGPIEQIDEGFAQLRAYCTQQETAEFAALCRELARQVAAMGEAHSLTWWNVI